MMGIKDTIQNSIKNKYRQKYELELQLQSDSYKRYITVHPEADIDNALPMVDAIDVFEEVVAVSYKEISHVLTDRRILGLEDVKYLLLVNGYGVISRAADRMITQAFEANPGVNVIYCDEDVYDYESGQREPWFKPDYSPDTLLSDMYFGNAVAIRMSALDGIKCETFESPYKTVYNMILMLTDVNDAFHIDSILYHLPEDFEAEPAECTDITTAAAVRRGYNRPAGNPKVSVIIPTKDHPDVLKCCIDSVIMKTEYGNYEIVVVDNGSNDENRRQIEAYLKKNNATYIYEPQEFNFSKMCNRGAEAANGEYLLFLNDDMEVKCGDYMQRMLNLAVREHVGAVGAKLLYPDSTLIQHIGITNMTEGPAHKLQGKDDVYEYYHGVNRGVRDVIGVTAACLMIDRRKYNEVEGFYEGLKVAYNDVDIDFKLIERGYYNVIDNDAVLYHHESLSRGDDALDERKQQRLREERELLYDRHPELYGNDSFYNKSLTGAGPLYEVIMPFENRNIIPVDKLIKLGRGYSFENINEALITHGDHLEMEKHSFDGRLCLLIDVHAHVRGLDSSDYEYRMIIRNGGNAYAVPATRRIRPDVARTYYNEINVELSGFVARIPKEMLEIGICEVWMEAKCVYSRQRLLNKVGIVECII